MGIDPLLTMYKSKPWSRSIFTKVDCQSLSRLYASFADLTTLSANETLLGALARTHDGKPTAVAIRETAFLFFDGDHPATDMTVPGLSPSVIEPVPGDRAELDRELGLLRITYTPIFYDGYFLRADGERFDPDEGDAIPYAASTHVALSCVAKWGFEDCADYFGALVVGMADKRT